ncbi:MAG: hypothetical protein N2D54_01410, partial [Chloroflexota bacterium]
MRALVGERDKRTVRGAASALQEQLNHRAAIIHGLALRTKDNVPPDLILDSIDYILPEFDVGIALFSQNGD